MTFVSPGHARLTATPCWIGGLLLALGTLLLAVESPLTEQGLGIGPWAANLVVLGAIVGASGFWLLQPRLESTDGLVVAGLLVAGGIACLIVATISEPLLARVVAAAAIVTGLRGAGHHLSALFPRLRYQGAMPLGEVAAIPSLVANAFARGGASGAVLGLTAPVAIAHVLLGLLFLSECGRRLTEIWLYRRA